MLRTGPKGRVFVNAKGGRCARRPAEGADLPDGFRFHDLRHTGNMWAAGTGANLRELMERMGHSSTRAALIYLHAAKDGDRSIAEGIARQLAGGNDADEGSGDR